MPNTIRDYFQAVCECNRLGNIESSYNLPIIRLITSFGCQAQDLSGGRSGDTGENIDVQLWREDDDVTDTAPFAGIEVKKINGIDARARGQIISEAKRYGNVILTDNLVWRFYHANGDDVKEYAGVQLIEAKDGAFVLREDNAGLFASLIEDFLLQSPAQIRSSNRLAQYMAKHAQTIRSVILGILKEDEYKQPLLDDRQRNLPQFDEMYGLYSKIREELRPALTTQDFADMYAQTIVYGLFIARYNDTTPESFDRYEAIRYLQEESALLNRFFTHITSTGRKHQTLEHTIDKLCELYRICDITQLLDQDESKDTIVHFYEEFLQSYDPALRKSLGVFYTPYQVVRWLVSMVDKALIEDFGIPKGLNDNSTSDITVKTTPTPVYVGKSKKPVMIDEKTIPVPNVAILDPACGTGTFHAEIIKYVKEKYYSGGRAAFYSDDIQKPDGLLSRLIAFEIMMTSYAVARLKIRRTINETLGFAPDTQLPTRIYLTNTLSAPHSGLERGDQIGFIDFSAAITEEAYHADKWKTRRPIKVIIGNPPYLAASKNTYDISAYKTETDGVTDFRERKHWLNDDYVQFFRFAEDIIKRNGDGILAYVSNNGYLDNPTFRGMRASLLRTFDKIFIVNLHGSANKKETAPNGGKDENIFEIMQGVSLFVGIKTTASETWAKVYHTDLWGLREAKFAALIDNTVQFTELNLDPKLAYFVPFGGDNKVAYESGISVAELFPVCSVGIVSGNDKSSIAPTRIELTRRINIIKNALDDKPIKELWGKLALGQTAGKIQDDVLLSDGVITPIAYRPFDERWTYYSGRSSGWLTRPLKKSIIGQLLINSETPVGRNIGLVFTRGDSTSYEFSMIFISDMLIDNRLTAAQTAGIASIAPLYLHSELGDTWMPNLDAQTLERLTAHMSRRPEPVEVFDYVYGILHDPVYRERFNEFLKRDYPRVPVVNAPDDGEGFHVSEEMFEAYVQAGERLRNLHLLREVEEAELTIEPAKPDDMVIGKIKYADGALHINAEVRILGIPEDVWAYRIGGYQVLDKWFKSHKGETFDLDRFTHIAKIVGALMGTLEVQEGLRERNFGSNNL